MAEHPTELKNQWIGGNFMQHRTKNPAFVTTRTSFWTAKAKMPLYPKAQLPGLALQLLPQESKPAHGRQYPGAEDAVDRRANPGSGQKEDGALP